MRLTRPGSYLLNIPAGLTIYVQLLFYSFNLFGIFFTLYHIYIKSIVRMFRIITLSLIQISYCIRYTITIKDTKILAISRLFPLDQWFLKKNPPHHFSVILYVSRKHFTSLPTPIRHSKKAYVSQRFNDPPSIVYGQTFPLYTRGAPSDWRGPAHYCFNTRRRSLSKWSAIRAEER